MIAKISAKLPKNKKRDRWQSKTMKEAHPFAKQIISSVLSKDFAINDSDLELRNINGWDSMKHLQLILTIERELSLTLSPDEIESIITVEI